MGFTTPCFIRKNTPELRKKLEELGCSHGKPEYYIDDDDNKYDFIMCHNGRFYAIADDITEALNDKLKGIKDGAFNIVVKWSNESMAFMACYVDGNQSPFSWFTNLLVYELEVVGNVFDNPDLIIRNDNGDNIIREKA